MIFVMKTQKPNRLLQRLPQSGNCACFYMNDAANALLADTIKSISSPIFVFYNCSANSNVPEKWSSVIGLVHHLVIE